MVDGNNQYFVTYSNYWGRKRNANSSTPQYDYADMFTGPACRGEATGMFAGADQETLSQFCKKGAVVQNAWMYVIWEMQDAVNDCFAGDINNNGGAAVAWDEAWAFYAGSLEGVDGSGSGVLLHALAEKRCPQFGTCTSGTSTAGDTTSTTIKDDAVVNARLLSLFKTGQTQILSGQCNRLQNTLHEVVKQMTVPVIQGALRYTYRADPNGPLQSSTTKDRAEGWVFASAVLPLIDQCNSSAASKIEQNMIWNAPTAMVDGYAFTKQQFESVYSCLGISCADVGGLRSEDGSYIEGMEPCVDILAGYNHKTNVIEHSEIDLDQQQIEAALSNNYDFDTASQWYSLGGNSVKSDGANRTIKGFSTGAFPKMVDGNNQYFVTYSNYWGRKRNANSSTPQYDYADMFTGPACRGEATGMFAGADQETLSQFCKKGAVVQNAWMYVIWEMQDAVNDCFAGDINNNGGAAVAWDEAWAFYAGSLEGVDGSGSGVLLHALAEKRCPQFGTCLTDVTAPGQSASTTVKSDAQVNHELLQLFRSGQSQIFAGQCGALQNTLNIIVKKITVPVIQGALRYAYRSDPNGPLRSSTTKDRAEGWVFAAAVLPLIDQCDAKAASEIEKNMIWNAPVAMTDGYVYTKQQFERVYKCLGVTCADIGGLKGADGVSYAPGMEPCIDALAGYYPSTNVVEHSKIDLDQRAIEQALMNNDFDGAYRAYAQGGNSIKSDGTNRTIQGFSTGAAKMQGKKWFNQYQRYWGSVKYADEFTSAACLGTGDLANAKNITRIELCKKGSATQNIWMYVVWEMEDAIDDCLNNDIADNGGSVHAWDEAWGFYAGSSEGETGSSTDGYLGYALAKKRCPQFGTCVEGTTQSKVNADILELFNVGQKQILAGQCSALEQTKDQIVQKMTVPIVQGALRYVYRADPANGVSNDEEVAEGWAFTAAVLPQIHYCDAKTAQAIRNNMIWNAAEPVKDGYIKVKEMFESAYSCMNIKCADVGELQENGVVFDGMKACQDAEDGNSNDDNDKLSPGTIAGIIIGIVAAITIFGVIMFCCGRQVERYQKFEKKEETKECSVASSVDARGHEAV